MMGRPRREYVPGNGQISRDVSPYIIPHGPADELQGGGTSSVQWVSSDRFTGIYGTMQFDNTVQDTERWADRVVLGAMSGRVSSSVPR
jgi:hypothetical protein